MTQEKGESNLHLEYPSFEELFQPVKLVLSLESVESLEDFGGKVQDYVSEKFGKFRGKRIKDNGITYLIDKELLDQAKPINVDFVESAFGSGFSISSKLSTCGPSCGTSCG